MSSLKHQIREEAKKLGFTQVGFAKIEALEKESKRLKKWLDEGKHGKMDYLANHFEIRKDPSKLVDGAKTIICLSFNYHFPNKDSSSKQPKIASYALGKDYHKVLKKKLNLLLRWLKENAEVKSGRCFVDSAPILERDWAIRSGLGWQGKNTLLIHPKMGSYFFLAEIIVDVEIENEDKVITDHCGTCTRCIDACPTQAIDSKGYLLDASKCISYLTIELKQEENIPIEFKGKMEDWIFGCDICQEVCPWNKFSTPHQEEAFLPKEELLNMTQKDWEELTEEKFNSLFYGSAVKRTKFKGLKRNIDFLGSLDGKIHNLPS
jgi:epoxyqueuosine reductase